MLSTEFKLGTDVAVVTGPIGASARAQTVDILAFGRSQDAYGGVSIEGAVISPHAGWNRDYYRKPVLVTDILIDQKVHNNQDNPLRMLLCPNPAQPQSHWADKRCQCTSRQYSSITTQTSDAITSLFHPTD